MESTSNLLYDLNDTLAEVAERHELFEGLDDGEVDDRLNAAAHQAAKLLSSTPTEALDKHLECTISVEVTSVENFRTDVEEGTVCLVKGTNYEVTEQIFTCDDHNVVLEVGNNFEWAT